MGGVKTLADLFDRCVPAPNGCWVWQRRTDKDGYGKIRYDGEHARAHRLAYKLHHDLDEFPELCVLHHCDNPPCCNPEHLFLGTNADNSRDMVQKGRAHKAAGEAHGYAKLTESQVQQIKLDTRTLSTIAREYRVHLSNISAIQLGKTWQHLDVCANDQPRPKRPTGAKFGEKNPSAKLTAEQVRQIKLDIRKAPAIAREYGVGPQIVRNIRRGINWKCLDQPVLALAA